MWLSVAFPTCPKCQNNSNECYHRNCPQGAQNPMEINPETSYVKCPSCKKEWPIKASNYFCSCNYVFSAKEVSIEIDAIVANAKLIVAEMRRQDATLSRIARLTDHDIAVKAEATVKKKFGEKIWMFLKRSLPIIIDVVKTWTHIT